MNDDTNKDDRSEFEEKLAEFDDAQEAEEKRVADSAHKHEAKTGGLWLLIETCRSDGRSSHELDDSTQALFATLDDAKKAAQTSVDDQASDDPDVELESLLVWDRHDDDWTTAYVDELELHFGAKRLVVRKLAAALVVQAADAAKQDAERRAAPEVVYVLTAACYESFSKTTYDDVLASVVGVAGCFEDAQALAQRHTELLLRELHENESEAAPEADRLVWSEEPTSDDSNGRQGEWRAHDKQNELVFAVTRWEKDSGGAS